MRRKQKESKSKNTLRERSRASNKEIEPGIESEREREQIILCMTASDSMYDRENKRGREKCEIERE